MIGFQMLHNQVVRSLSIECLLQILFPFLCLGGIHRIHNGHLLILNQIRVVGHTQRHIVLTFEEIYVKVIHTDVFHIRCNCIIFHSYYNYLSLS